jgi:hypothetical protein
MDRRILGLVRVVDAEGPILPGPRRMCWCRGRVVPTTLLCRFGLTWSATDPHHIVATHILDDTELEVRHVLADDGRVRSVAFER